VSAWIVSKRHIDLLVSVILRSEAVPEAGGNADKIGTELWTECHRSVNYRYSENEPTPEYHHQPYPLDVAGDAYLFLVKQVDCYQYQSCEHPGWDDSAARRWTNELREMWARRAGVDFPGSAFDPAVRDLRVNRSYPAAYERAPWGIDDEDTEDQTYQVEDRAGWS
jgi:hypothetical protein